MRLRCVWKRNQTSDITAVTTLILCELLAFKAGKRIGPLSIVAILIGALITVSC